MRARRQREIYGFFLLVLALVWAWPAAAQSWRAREVSLDTVPTVRLRSGSIPTTDGLQLNLTANRGSVLIFTDADNEVRYTVRAEADQGDLAAALAKSFSFQTRKTAQGINLIGQVPAGDDFKRVWVSYEIHVPRRYGLAISSKAGDIVAQDIEGRISLQTGGGNIRTGSVSGVNSGAKGEFAAALQTGGGSIAVGDVSGSLRAVSAGGHISAGNVDGDAVIRTDGGHIRIGHVRGNEQLFTGGGNIAAERADDVAAETAGGRLEFAEANGTIHARTSGGGIRIAHIVGPTELDSENGAVFVAGIEAPLHASAKNGTITAWFSPRQGPQAEAPSDLSSGRGDIVVYLPRAMAVSIDAQVDQNTGHHIIADPALRLTPIALKTRTDDTAPGMLRAQAAMNGGGNVLHLKTAAGDIRLLLLDTDNEEWLDGLQAAFAQQEMLQRAFLQEMDQDVDAIMEGTASQSQPTRVDSQSRGVPDASALPGGFMAIARLFEGMWRGGGVWVDPDEQQKRLVQAVRPAYPEAAREAGLEGDVTMQVEIGPDGTVKDVRPMSGDPELARAAVNALWQWRYSPALLDGRPVSVVTTVTLAFRLG